MKMLGMAAVVSSVEASSGYGSQLSSCPVTPYQFNVTGSTANNNGGYGFEARTSVGEIVIDGSHATGNVYSGFLVERFRQFYSGDYPPIVCPGPHHDHGQQRR